MDVSCISIIIERGDDDYICIETVHGDCNYIELKDSECNWDWVSGFYNKIDYTLTNDWNLERICPPDIKSLLKYSPKIAIFKNGLGHTPGDTN